MKKIIYYSNFKIHNFNITIGIYENKLCYIGLNNDEILTWFNKNKFELIKDNSKISKSKLELINMFFNKEKLNIDLNDLNPFGTDFQKEVWKEMMKLDYGQNITYSQLALNINKPNAIRAVASAAAKNPILLLIPCHRIISKSNAVKFRSGPEVKLKLQELEK